MGKKAKAKKSPKKAKAKGDKKDPVSKAKTADDSSAAVKLRKTIRKMMTDLEREKKYQNEFQEQEAKIETFWIMEKKRLDDLRMELRNKFRQKQDLEERQNYKLKNYKERVKHLLQEQQTTVTGVRIESEISLQKDQDENRDDEHHKTVDVRAKKVDTKETEHHHSNLVLELRSSHETAVMALRREFQLKSDDVKRSFEEKMRTIRAEASEQRKSEILKIEQRKTDHVEHLMTQHKLAFNEIKSYYNDITHQNLDLIKSLKGEVMEMKKKENTKEKAMMEIAHENRKLSEPFKKHLLEVDDLNDKLQAYEQDKDELNAIKSDIALLDEQLQGLQWQHEVQFQRLERVEKERDNLKSQLESSIYDMQQKSGFRNLVLEKKLETIKQDLEKKETALHEVMMSMNMPPQVLGNLSKKLEDVLLSKNESLASLEEKLSLLKERYYQAIGLYEATMRNFDIPPAELGFTPVVI